MHVTINMDMPTIFRMLYVFEGDSKTINACAPTQHGTKRLDNTVVLTTIVSLNKVDDLSNITFALNYVQAAQIFVRSCVILIADF